MNRILNNPLLFLFSCGKKRLKKEDKPGIKWYLILLPFIILVLLRGVNAICPCTLFTIAAFLQLFMVITIPGGFVITSIISEKEKNTFDLLRLTSLGPEGIIAGKLIPEIFQLFKIIALTSPFLLLLGWGFTGTSFVTPFWAIIISTFSGFTLLFGLVFLSTVAGNISFAIVMSWLLRIAWLLVTPVIDILLAYIFLRHSVIPVISNLNPLLPLVTLIVPEALEGTKWVWASYLFIPATVLFCIATFIYSAKIIEKDKKNSSRVNKGKENFFKEGNFWESFSSISIFKNPVFLKEMAALRTDLPGFIPGVLVFIVLLLAPCFYSAKTNVHIFEGSTISSKPVNHVNNELLNTGVVDEEFTHIDYDFYMSPQGETGNDNNINNPETMIPPPAVNSEEKTYVIKGHNQNLCLRLFLFNRFSIPLPSGGSFEDNIETENSGDKGTSTDNSTAYTENPNLSEESSSPEEPSNPSPQPLKYTSLEDWFLDSSASSLFIRISYRTLDNLKGKISQEKISRLTSIPNRYSFYQITDSVIEELKNDLSQDKINSLESLKNINSGWEYLYSRLQGLNFTEDEISMVENYAGCYQASDNYADNMNVIPQNGFTTFLANLRFTREEMLITINNIAPEDYIDKTPATSTEEEAASSTTDLPFGFYMSLLLLLPYLVIRCSGFLCSTYNTEKNRGTWNMLKLTLVTPEDIVKGKLLGVLLIPILQMTLGFLALTFWICNDVITVSGAAGFYIFCILLALLGGLIGQYNSLTSPAAHVSQGKTFLMLALMAVFMPAAIHGILKIIYFMGVNVIFTGDFFLIPFLTNNYLGSFTFSPLNFMVTSTALIIAIYLFWKYTVKRVEKELEL